MWKRGIFFAIAACGSLLIASCSSESRNDDQSGPGWVRQPARTVDGGYIVYVGNAEDRNPDHARFKAEAVALEDLANECSFPPKGARVEDRFERQLGNLHQAYVKVAVDYQTCEEAKQTVDPAAVRNLANVAMTNEIKRYQDDVEDEDEEDASNDQNLSPQTKAVLASQYAPPPASITNETEFFVVRQQVFYAKQDVILAPPEAYPPGAPQTTTYVHNVTASTQQVGTFAAANPALKSTPQTWNSVRSNVARAANRPMGGRSQSFHGNGGNHHPNGGGQKRKKHWRNH
jgi:hypothetical protein